MELKSEPELPSSRDLIYSGTIYDNYQSSKNLISAHIVYEDVGTLSRVKIYQSDDNRKNSYSSIMIHMPQEQGDIKFNEI